MDLHNSDAKPKFEFDVAERKGGAAVPPLFFANLSVHERISVDLHYEGAKPKFEFNVAERRGPNFPVIFANLFVHGRISVDLQN